MPAHDEPLEAEPRQSQPVSHTNANPTETVSRLAHAIVTLADDMHAAVIDTWEPLTGLQVMFLKRIARGGRVTRADLRRDCRTSSAAVAPGLASLIHQGHVVEIPDGEERVLILGSAGRDLLARITLVQAESLRQTLSTHTRLDANSIHDLTSALEYLRTDGTPYR